MTKYKCLNYQSYKNGDFQIVPIRFQDRYKIMNWRNEQMYHLRQSKALTIEDQDSYFNNTISSLFDKNYPNQILFSFLERGNCIGYGGLVHLNWEKKSGEISFLISTELELNFFKKLWSIFLKLIEEVAFRNLNLNRIYTYAFDVRPKLYECLEENGFKLEQIIENDNNKIVIHTKYNICDK